MTSEQNPCAKLNLTLVVSGRGAQAERRSKDVAVGNREGRVVKDIEELPPQLELSFLENSGVLHQGKGVLQTGERNNVAGGRVIVVPGPAEEVSTVREIYRLRVRGKHSAK